MPTPGRMEGPLVQLRELIAYLLIAMLVAAGVWLVRRMRAEKRLRRLRR